MRSKPAILFFALLLLLSIGGALFYQHVRQDRPPSFDKIDAFLKNEAATGDWTFGRHIPKRPYNHPRPGWWDHLRIHRSDHFQTDQYAFVHASKEHAAIAMVLRKNGVVQLLTVNIAYVGSSNRRDLLLAGDLVGSKKSERRLKELEKSIYGKFPLFTPEQIPPIP